MQGEITINCSWNFFPNGFAFLSNHCGAHRQATLTVFRQGSKPQSCVYAVSTATTEVPVLSSVCPSGMLHATGHRTDSKHL